MTFEVKVEMEKDRELQWNLSSDLRANLSLTLSMNGFVNDVNWGNYSETLVSPSRIDATACLRSMQFRLHWPDIRAPNAEKKTWPKTLARAGVYAAEYPYCLPTPITIFAKTGY